MKFKTTLLVLSAFTISSIALAQSINIKVLFVGNSYTMPLQSPIDRIFTAMGDTIFADFSAGGGQTLKNHDEMPMFEEALRREKFDYVVLQEQSQMPSFPPNQVKQEVYPFAKSLVDKIRKQDSCIEPVFYMTWGRKNGDKANCPNYKPLCTYAGMQRRLRASYMEMAYDNKATVSPVGMAWKAVRAAKPNMNLYEGDESHPNENGVYLTACVFYSVLTQKSAYGASDKLGMDTSKAHFLEKMAAQIVLDSMPVWRINANLANANFQYAGEGKSYGFKAEKESVGKRKWYFGNDGTAFGDSVAHTFTADGDYTVSMVHATACGKDSSSTNITVTSTGINSIENVLEVFPNPANEHLFIKGLNTLSQVAIYDQMGRTYPIELHENQIDISTLPKGFYVLKITMDQKVVEKSFIKE